MFLLKFRFGRSLIHYEKSCVGNKLHVSNNEEDTTFLQAVTFIDAANKSYILALSIITHCPFSFSMEGNSEPIPRVQVQEREL